jgi:alpha-glucosidase
MRSLHETLHAIRLAGLPNVLRAVRYARLRDRLDARYLYPEPSPEPRPRGRLRFAARTESGARFRYDGGELDVRFLAPDFLALAWDGPALAASEAVVGLDWPKVDVTLAPAASGGWSLRSPTHELRLAEDGELELWSVPEAMGKSPAAAPAAAPSAASARCLRREQPVLRRGEARQGGRREARQGGRRGGWSQVVELAPEAAVAGLGERAAPFNLRPGSYRFWNRDAGGKYGPGEDPLYLCIPVYVTLDGGGACLAFYDNSWDGSISLGEQAEIRFTGGPARWYLAAGSLARVLELYTQLTGRAPLPPRWALGYQHSRWGWGSQAKMRSIAEGFLRRGLPLRALYLDIDCLRGHRVLTPDLRRYPQLASWARELGAQDVHLVASVNPGLKRERRFELYTEARRLGLLCRRPNGSPMPGVCWPGWAAWVDFTSPRARQWWGRQYARLRKLGIEGFWHDMNEPAVFAAHGDPSLPLCTRHELEGRGGDHREAHNLYGLGMNRAGYEGLRALDPERRPFLLSRSGWAGGQRYAWTWTGDMRTGWDNLRQTLATVLGLSLSGFPFAGPDVGGFSGEPPSAELFVRWFQLASFLPFFRTHCTSYMPPREPWEFGAETEAILAKALRLRDRLLPYWYTLAWQAGRTGAPPARPPCWAHPESAELRAADDAFLLGDALLVAPVFEPGATRRSVTLPPGEWRELEGEGRFTGPGRAELDAPLERIPVLVRAGSVLPVAGAEDSQPAPGSRPVLGLMVFRPAGAEAGSGLLYSDAGDGYGPHRVDRFALDQAQGGWILSWADEGEYPWPYAEVSLELRGFRAPQVRDEGTLLGARGGCYPLVRRAPREEQPAPPERRAPRVIRIEERS